MGTIVRVLVLLAAVGLGAESGARLDDYFSNSISLIATPSLDDLWHRDDGVRRGKPHMRFRAITLNNIGVQGPDITGPPKPDCPRVLFLGSSETFGIPAVANDAYPARVQMALPPSRCFEIQNASIPGMSMSGMLPYWHKLSMLRPRVVFIYPATHFYVGSVGEPPKPVATKAPAPVSARAGFPSVGELLALSRFIDRLRDYIDMPESIERRQEEKAINDQTQGRDPSWYFTSVPSARLDALRNDTSALIDAVAATGATPILMSHAVSVASIPRPEDRADLHAMRVFTPRASEEVLAAFPYRANEMLRQLAQAKGIRFLDVAADLSGKRDYFVDMVHFTPAGATAVAGMIVQTLEQ